MDAKKTWEITERMMQGQFTADAATFGKGSKGYEDAFNAAHMKTKASFSAAKVGERFSVYRSAINSNREYYVAQESTEVKKDETFNQWYHKHVRAMSAKATAERSKTKDANPQPGPAAGKKTYPRNSEERRNDWKYTPVSKMSESEIRKEIADLEKRIRVLTALPNSHHWDRSIISDHQNRIRELKKALTKDADLGNPFIPHKHYQDFPSEEKAQEFVKRLKSQGAKNIATSSDRDRLNNKTRYRVAWDASPMEMLKAVNEAQKAVQRAEKGSAEYNAAKKKLDALVAEMAKANRAFEAAGGKYKRTSEGQANRANADAAPDRKGMSMDPHTGMWHTAKEWQILDKVAKKLFGVGIHSLDADDQSDVYCYAEEHGML